MSAVLKKKDHGLSRREFLTTAVAAGGGMLLGPPWLNAADDGHDPRMGGIMSRTVALDMHNHVIPAGTEPHPQGQPPRQDEQQQAPALSLVQELRQSGLTAVCASYGL